MKPILFPVVLAAATIVAPLVASPAPQLVVLAPTGQTRNGLPVLARHASPEATEQVLTRGFSGRLLRLYSLEQEYLRLETGAPPEPAYLLLSDRQGGYPQFGFALGSTDKPSTGWVDLHKASMLVGRFGSMEQIFPHELMHVIVRQLAGEPRESGGNQVHAVGVRTDPVNAFQEGFAEHVQVMAIDDADALPETRALRTESDVRPRALRDLEGYVRDLGTRSTLVPPSQMRFLLWFSQAEQVLRYDAVRQNLFARTPDVPAPLLARPDKYAAYLASSVMPGRKDGAPKSVGVMMSTEGVVAYLFWRWATDGDLQHHYRDRAFYARFGTRPEDVPPLENAYLKLFHALRLGRPSDGAGLIDAYKAVFPDEGAAVDRVVNEALLGQALSRAPEIWLANAALQTGTSLFDQFRGMSRPHTFDINAASTLDWMAVPGVTTNLAERLVRAAPYSGLSALKQVRGMNHVVQQQVTDMAAAMERLRSRSKQDEESLSLSALIRPYAWRLFGVWCAAAIGAAWLVKRLGARRWIGATAIGAVAAAVVLVCAWVIVCPPWLPVLAPAIALGVPAAVWRSVKRRSRLDVLRVVAFWLAAALPAGYLSRSWF